MGFGVSVQNKVCISIWPKILSASPVCLLIEFLHFCDIWAFRCGRLTVYLRFSPARSKLLQPQQCATGYPRFRQLGSGRALKIDAVAVADQKFLAPVQQEIMRRAGVIHQADTLVPSYGRPPDGNTHALHRFIGSLANRLKQQNTSNDDVC